MIQMVITIMILVGAGLMVYNIYGFIQFARTVKAQESWKSNNAILYIPVGLLMFFLLGYLVVGVFGHPDIIMGGILLGGSIFVFIVYRILDSIIRQIIENEKLEAEIIAAEQSNRAKTKFLATVSHEMRTPMNVIIGLDRIALMEPGISDSMRDHLDKIGLSARHLLGLINNILELNRIGPEENSVRVEPFPLREYINQVSAIMETECQEKGLAFHLTCTDHMGGWYLGDGDLLKQVLLALLDNAVKYTDAPGTVELIVETAPAVNADSADGGVSDAPDDDAGQSRECFRFSVRDTGIGMEKDFLDRAFDPFTQEDGSFTDRFGGSGLGLAVTRQHVERMGGEITAESAKGVGSTFTVTLCLTPTRSEESKEAEELGDMLESLKGCRILIVEDLPANAEILEDLLELEGAETEHAENGKVGLDMMAASESGYYDAILMDLRMPVMDGLEACRRIRELEHPDAGTIPIIAVTANAAEQDVRECQYVGMNAHLAKPADADLLYDTLKRMIRK